MLFDITKLRVSDTATIHLKGPDKEFLYADAEREKPIRVQLYGPGSKQFAAIDSRQTARAVKRANENEGRVVAVPAEQRTADQAADLAAITIAFENFEYPAPEGTSYGSPTEMFEALYADPKLGFLTQQVTKACTDWGNFRPASKAA